MSQKTDFYSVKTQIHSHDTTNIMKMIMIIIIGGRVPGDGHAPMMNEKEKNKIRNYDEWKRE